MAVPCQRQPNATMCKCKCVHVQMCTCANERILTNASVYMCIMCICWNYTFPCNAWLWPRNFLFIVFGCFCNSAFSKLGCSCIVQLFLITFEGGTAAPHCACGWYTPRVLEYHQWSLPSVIHLFWIRLLNVNDTSQCSTLQCPLGCICHRLADPFVDHIPWSPVGYIIYILYIYVHIIYIIYN